MISFRQFILQEQAEQETSVATMKRQGITHLNLMKPEAFLTWLETVKNEASGLLGSHNVKAALKVDGLGFRFGKSSTGQIFVEGSRTGPQFEPGAFSAYAKSKGSDEVVIQRALHYDDIFSHFKKNKKLMDLVPNNTKVYCELFYVPMAELVDDTGVKFVTIKYDRKKLGNLMTICIFDILNAETNQKHPNAEEIKKTLIEKGSTSEIKVVSPDLDFIGEIDINGEIDLVDNLIKNKSETLRIVSSRKGEDKITKQNVLQLIDVAKKKLSEKVLFNKNLCGMDRLCDPENNEGIVLDLPKNLGSVKVTSPKFQMAHHGFVK